MTDDLFEATGAARKLVEDIMLVKLGEQVVITADRGSDLSVVRVTAEAVHALGATPTVIWYQAREEENREPPRPVAAAIAESDVWIEYAVGYLMYTDACTRAINRGSRYICLCGMDVEMMVRTLGRVDYPKLLALGDLLRSLVANARIVRLTSRSGSDLVADNAGRPVRHSGKRADTPGDTVVLGGQISWCPLEETINGRIVFDGFISAPHELGVLRSPVCLSIKAGSIICIEGEEDARIFREWLTSFNDPNMLRIAHYSLGFNPGVTKPTGRIAEDECVFGCIDFGIGTQAPMIGGAGWKAATHADGTILKPTIYLDEEPLEIDGKYVHPDVVLACRVLHVSGY